MRFLALFLFFLPLLYGNEAITVNLRNPKFSSGTLQSEEGGVVEGPSFRLQAQNITYTKTKSSHQVSASGFVMLDTGDYIFVGDSLEYDFLTKSGLIRNATASDSPWIFGGDLIELKSDGSYVIHEAFITTAETRPFEWELKSRKVILNKCRSLHAEKMQLRVLSLPLLFLPSFTVNLDSFNDVPLRVYARWGGKRGTRIGVQYELFTFYRFSTFLRFDWRFKRGPGGGIETYYLSDDHRQSLETINFIARDNSISNPHEKTRYRFQGIYTNSLFDDKVSVRASWDKLSDMDMATDYNDNGLELDTAGRTELIIRKQDEYWITNFRARLRVNRFQTLKQELPSFLFTQKPYKLDNIGVIFENNLEISYLDFVYSNDIRNVEDYHSTRVQHNFLVYKPYQFCWFNIMPQAGSSSLFYGNSYDGNPKFLTIGLIGIDANTNYYKQWKRFKHTVTPYASWQYLTTPTISPDDHYIFDITDGLWRLNTVKIGVKQDLFYKYTPADIQRLIALDIYTFAFVDSRPPNKLFAELVSFTTPSIKHIIQAGWDFTNKTLDHVNFRKEWTVSKNMALICEWRHRSQFSYRKAVRDNFILESFRSTKELLHSSVSDRRDTLLLHFYWRFHPQWSLEFESRSGWNRKHEPSYREFEIDLITTTKSHWNIKFSYQLKEDDHRLAIYFSLDTWIPSRENSCLKLPLRF